MKETLGERIGAQDGGDWVQTGTNIRAQDQVQQQNLASGRFSAQRKLELRKKLSKLIALEAEDKYISTTAMPQPAFETNNYKYLSAERGRNFGREPTEEFKKDTLMRMLNRRSSPAGVFNRTRLTSEMSYLIDSIKDDFTEEELAQEIKILVDDHSSNKPLSQLLIKGHRQLDQAKAGEIDHVSPSIYEQLGLGGRTSELSEDFSTIEEVINSEDTSDYNPYFNTYNAVEYPNEKRRAARAASKAKKAAGEKPEKITKGRPPYKQRGGYSVFKGFSVLPDVESLYETRLMRFKHKMSHRYAGNLDALGLRSSVINTTKAGLRNK